MLHIIEMDLDTWEILCHNAVMNHSGHDQQQIGICGCEKDNISECAEELKNTVSGNSGCVSSSTGAHSFTHLASLVVSD